MWVLLSTITWSKMFRETRFPAPLPSRRNLSSRLFPAKRGLAAAKSSDAAQLKAYG
jgi:hypothetical protein